MAALRHGYTQPGHQPASQQALARAVSDAAAPLFSYDWNIVSRSSLSLCSIDCSAGGVVSVFATLLLGRPCECCQGFPGCSDAAAMLSLAKVTTRSPPAQSGIKARRELHCWLAGRERRAHDTQDTSVCLSACLCTFMHVCCSLSPHLVQPVNSPLGYQAYDW
jgi:hypothetical protein